MGLDVLLTPTAVSIREKIQFVQLALSNKEILSACASGSRHGHY